MKLLNLPSAEDGFKFQPVDFCGIESYLIIPQITAKWHRNNLHMRSLIVRGSDLEILSSGWPKFMNHGEKPDAYPNPESYKDWSITEKIDGSLVICDYINGEFNMRTRGTVSYSSQDNADDFAMLPTLYPNLVGWMSENPNISLLWEIMTPNNVIVLRSDIVQFFLLGGVDKEKGTVLSVKEVDEIAQKLNAPQPKVYWFNNLNELIEIVKNWKGQEGVVVSYNKNQNRVKIKGDWYCMVHRIKSELNSENNLIEYYVNEGMPDYQTFYQTIEKNFDFEIAEQLRGQISKMVNSGQEVKRIEIGMQNFISSIRNFDTRKEQAIAVMSSYGGSGNSRAAMVFSLLDKKPLTKDQLVKLMWQALKQ